MTKFIMGLHLSVSNLNSEYNDIGKVNAMREVKGECLWSVVAVSPIAVCRVAF